MAQTEKIEIPIEVLDNATKGTKSIGGSLTELKSGIDLAIQAAQKLKQAYDFAKEGAQIEFTKERFDRLATSIGTTADVMLEKMKVATKGTLSDMEAMGAATDLLSLGLAKTEDEAIRLATVQAGLAMDMNQLVLTLSNQTTMRFDQLGVSVDGFKERVDALKASGMDANTAFKEAFLQQAEAQLERVGNAADSAAGEFAKLEASAKNAWDELKVGASNAALPLVKAVNAENALIEAAEKHIITMEDANEQINKFTWTSYTAADAIEWLTEKQRINAEGLEAVETLYGSYDKKFKNHIETMEEAATITEEMSDANKAWLDLLAEEQDIFDDSTEKYSDFGEKRADLYRKIEETPFWDTKTIAEYQEKLDELQEDEEEYTAEYETKSKRRILSMVEEQLAADGLTEAEMQYLERLGIEWGVYTQSAVDAAQETRAQVGDIVRAFEEIPTEKTFTLNIRSIGTIGELGFGGGRFDSAPSSRRRAGGGPISAGIPYMVGESGPEMVVPNQSGTVIPNNQLGIDYKKMARAITGAMAQWMQQ